MGNAIIYEWVWLLKRVEALNQIMGVVPLTLSGCRYMLAYSFSKVGVAFAMKE